MAFILWALIEHMNDETLYKNLTRAQALWHMWKLHCQVVRFLNKYIIDRGSFSPPWTKKNSDKMPKLWMIKKANKQPEKRRPIICCMGIILHNLSQWHDFQIQNLKNLILSYVKYRQDLINKWAKMGLLHSKQNILPLMLSPCAQALTYNMPLPQLWHGITIRKIPTNCHQTSH